MAGWALLVPAGNVIALLAIWAAVYVAAPFVEELWLEYTYEAESLHSTKRVPRFSGLGWSSH